MNLASYINSVAAAAAAAAAATAIAGHRVIKPEPSLEHRTLGPENFVRKPPPNSMNADSPKGPEPKPLVIEYGLSSKSCCRAASPLSSCTLPLALPVTAWTTSSHTWRLGLLFSHARTYLSIYSPTYPRAWLAVVCIILNAHPCLRALAFYGIYHIPLPAVL